MAIRRERYLKALVERMHNGMIKVVIGACVKIGLNQEKSYNKYHLLDLITGIMNTSLSDNKIINKFCYIIKGNGRILYVSFGNCIRWTFFGEQSGHQPGLFPKHAEIVEKFKVLW